MGYGTDQETLIGIIGPGTCFGELGLLMNSPAIYTVIAYSDVYAVRVTEDKMSDFIQENHSTVLQIMKDMAHTMAVMQYQILSLTDELNTYTKNGDQRLEELKKELAKSMHNPNHVSMKDAKLYFLGRKK